MTNLAMVTRRYGTKEGLARHAFEQYVRPWLQADSLSSIDSARHALQSFGKELQLDAAVERLAGALNDFGIEIQPGLVTACLEEISSAAFQDYEHARGAKDKAAELLGQQPRTRVAAPAYLYRLDKLQALSSAVYQLR